MGVLLHCARNHRLVVEIQGGAVVKATSALIMGPRHGLALRSRESLLTFSLSHAPSLGSALIRAWSASLVPAVTP